MKPAPLTVNVKAAPPADAFVGERVVIDGTGLLMVNVGGKGLGSTPPPGVGLKVSTLTICAVARLAAGTWTVRVLALVTVTAFAGSAMRLNSTKVPPVRKLLPFTVRASPLDPAGTVVGEIEVIPGIGLRTVNTNELLVLAPWVTVIWAATPEATSVAKIEAVN